jgi:Ser/Thr protein kinase RdoA (MazF antagonist)
VESLSADDRDFSACCYERVEGPLWQEVRYPSDHVVAVGQLAGKMHAVSAEYTPTREGASRPLWSDAPWFASPADVIHPSMLGVIEMCHRLREAIDRLPARDRGLVHDDLHGGNVVITGGGPAAIDFECSHYSRLVSEIGSALYFWLWKTPDSDAQDLTRRATAFLRAFMRGYRREHDLSERWLEALPLFLKARELSIFASYGLQREDFESHGRHDRTFAWMKANIEKGVPYVELDLASL